MSVGAQPLAVKRIDGHAPDLGHVAVALAAALTVDDVLDVVTGVALPLCDGDGLLLSLVRGKDLQLVRWLGYAAEPLRRLEQVRRDAPTPLAETAAGVTAIFLGSPGAYLARYPDAAALVPVTGKQAWAFLPLVAARQTFGTLLVSYLEPRTFGSVERAQLLALAGLCAQALERARLLEVSQQVSVALQRALLPDALPVVPGLSFAARYRPASQPDQVVGGDWYDAYHAEDGWVAMSIGDVVGHDIAAAALMGEVRHTVRAFASEGHGPSGVLHRVNRLLAAERPSDGPAPERMATCFYLQMDPLSGVGTAVSAGHPLPIVLRPGEDPRLLIVATSLPLGVLADASLVESSGALLPGDVLLLYTDGLVEAPDVPVGDGIAALLDRLRELGGVVDLERLADAVMATCSESSDDDVALLLVRYEPVEQPRRQVTRRFADEAVSVSLARRFTRDVVDAWSVNDLQDRVLLVTTELVTNAVAHTVGYCELTLQLTGRTLRIEVRDRGTRLPTAGPPAEVDPDAEGGRGLLIIAALADRFGVEDHGNTKIVWAEVDR